MSKNKMKRYYKMDPAEAMRRHKEYVEHHENRIKMAYGTLGRMYEHERDAPRGHLIEGLEEAKQEAKDIIDESKKALQDASRAKATYRIPQILIPKSQPSSSS